MFTSTHDSLHTHGMHDTYAINWIRNAYSIQNVKKLETTTIQIDVDQG